MATKKVKVKLIENGIQPEMVNGNWYDCTTREVHIVRRNDMDTEIIATRGVLAIRPGDVIMMKLGFATDMGKGYEGQLKPRSSTFKKYGLLQGNSVGLIDDTYCGDGDEWMVYWYATRNSVIPVNGRFCQMTIEKSAPKFEMDVVDTLGNPDRGGHGTTGN